MTAMGAMAAVAAPVASAIEAAARRTGTDPAWLLATARVESGLKANAAAATSSARGLFQFTQASWLGTMRRHGAALGLGEAAEAISSGAAAAGTKAREAILALRDDPQVASLMAGALASDNGAALGRVLGRAATSPELYMAHFLGAGGATKFLTALEATPGMAAASLMPVAAAANRAIFHKPGGEARSLAEVMAVVSDRLGRAAAPSGSALPLAGNSLPAAGKPLPVPAATALSQVRMAYMLLAELGA